MLVNFKQDGGIVAFSGRSREVEFDADDLEPGERADLEELIESADFFGRFEEPCLGGKDRITYRLTIVDGGRCRTLHLEDPLPEDLIPLMARVQRISRAVLRATRNFS